MQEHNQGLFIKEQFLVSRTKKKINSTAKWRVEGRVGHDRI